MLAPADIGWQHDPNVLRDIYNCEPLPCYGDGVTADPSPYEPFIVQDVRRRPRRRHCASTSRRSYRLDEARRRAAAGEATWDVLVSPTVPIPPPPIDGPDLTLHA